MVIKIDKTEFEGIGYFGDEQELYMSMLPNGTVEEIENLIANNKSITCGEDTYTGYTDLDALSFTYHTRVGNEEVKALNIQVKRG